MADGHGSSPVTFVLGKGKAPVFQATDVLQADREGTSALPTTVNLAQAASPSSFAHPVMVPRGGPSTSAAQQWRAGLSPQAPSEGFPPLAQNPRPTQAKKRRFKELQRRLPQPPVESNTAFSISGLSNTANSGFGHQFPNTWQGPQFNYAHQMGTQQRAHSFDEGRSFQPLFGGHVATPTWVPRQQQANFQPDDTLFSFGARQLADPTAHPTASRSFPAQLMREGHVSTTYPPSFPSTGNNTFGPATWQTQMPMWQTTSPLAGQLNPFLSQNPTVEECMSGRGAPYKFKKCPTVE